MNMKNNNIELYDTTLRDGTQQEGISLSVQDKLLITKRLDDFGVHYIEGGWPGSNPKDAEFFGLIPIKYSINWLTVRLFLSSVILLVSKDFLTPPVKFTVIIKIIIFNSNNCFLFS